MQKAEGGIAFLKTDVICDEAYGNFCRITAERCEAGHIAVVCAVRGGSIQSFIFSEEEYESVLSKMKEELAYIFEEATEKDRELSRFFARYTAATCRKKNFLGE